MRKFLIGLLIVLLLLGGVLTYAFMNVNRILEDNRERLAGMASDAVGRDVTFESASVAFSRGLAVRVEDLRIAEDPKFGKGDFVALDSAFVGVRIWPALFGEIEVTGVRLDSPVIQVISTAAGFNFETLGGPAAEPDPSAPDEPAGEPMAVAIAAFEIDDGLVTYEDRTQDPPLRLTIDQLQTSGSDLALEGPAELSFAFRLRPTGAPTDGSAPMSRFEGRVDLDDVAVPSGRLFVESPELFPSIAGAGFVGDPMGDRMKDLEVEVGLPADAAQAGYPLSLRSSSGSLAGFDYRDAEIAARYREDQVDLERMLVGIADGDVALSGRMALAAAGQPAPFSLDLDLRDLASGKLAAALLGTPEQAVSGRIGGDVTLSGQSLEWESLKRSLAGAISLQMQDGALEQVNLLDTLVARMVDDPGLGMVVASSIREAAPNALKGDRTVIERLGLDFDITKGTLTSDDLELIAGDFAVTAVGKVGLDGSVAGNGTFRLSEAISKQLVQRTDALSALQGEGGRVEVPIRIGGTATAMNLRPDLSALAAGAKRELRDKAAGEIADRIFGKRGEATEGEAKEEGAPPTEREAAEDVLRKGLGRLLGD